MVIFLPSSQDFAESYFPANPLWPHGWRWFEEGKNFTPSYPGRKLLPWVGYGTVFLRSDR